MPEIKHGISTWLRTGKVNPSIRGHKKLQKYLRAIEADLIKDLGGLESLTTAQEILIKATIEGYGVLLLSVMYCKKYSVLRPDQARKGIIELQPVLGHQFLAFLNTLRQNLVALGLDKRKVNEALDLKTYIAKNYPDKPEEKARDSQQAEAEVPNG
jgi:hypothetical protein